MNPYGNTKHGQHGSLTYKRWKAMRQRTSAKQSAFHAQYYSDVKCCERWADFGNFLADMGECPEGHTLDRKNGDLGYEPNNCRWATVAEQNANRSCCIPMTHNGITKNATDWAKELGMRPGTLIQRLRLGWSHDRALTIPVKGSPP